MPEVAEKQSVSLWIFDFLSVNVCQYDVYDLCCSSGTAAVILHHTIVDSANTMVCEGWSAGLGTAVCVWLLQPDADKHDAWYFDNAGV